MAENEVVELPPLYEVEEVPIERRLFPRGRRGETVAPPEGKLPAHDRRRTIGRRADDRTRRLRRR